MKALVSGESGFKMLSQILIMMLQTLLQDRLAEVSLVLQCCFSLVYPFIQQSSLQWIETNAINKGYT